MHGRAHPGMPAVIAGIALAAALGGCGASSGTPRLNTSAVEHGIAHSILVQHDVNAVVTCPPSVARRQGLTFTCTAGLQAGRYPVSVVEADGRGHVRWANPHPMVILVIARVQRAITRSIHVQRGLRATVTCPSQVLQSAGVAFTCQADVRHHRYPFTVTEVDDHGHVRYVGA